MCKGSRPLSAKPHSTIRTVSSEHGILNSSRIGQHNVTLHLWLKAVQVRKEQISGAHYTHDLHHQRTEFFVVTLYRGLLPKIQQFSLMSQVVVQVLKLIGKV